MHGIFNTEYPVHSEGKLVSVFIAHENINWLKRAGRMIWDGLLLPQRIALVVLSLYTSGLIVAEVIFRYFLHLSLLWVEELTLYVVFWFYLMGATLCTHERTHIKGGAVHLILRNRPKAHGVFRIGGAVLSLGLSSLFIFWGYEAFAYTLGVGRTTVHLYLPAAYAQLSLVPGFALMALYFLSESIDLIRGWVRGTL